VSDTDMRANDHWKDDVKVNLPNGDTITLNNSLLRVIASAAYTFYFEEEGEENEYTKKTLKFYRACVRGDRNG
jgi:hypothetical protein